MASFGNFRGNRRHGTSDNTTSKAFTLARLHAPIGADDVDVEPTQTWTPPTYSFSSTTTTTDDWIN